MCIHGTGTVPQGQVCSLHVHTVLSAGAEPVMPAHEAQDRVYRVTRGRNGAEGLVDTLVFACVSLSVLVRA